MCFGNHSLPGQGKAERACRGTPPKQNRNCIAAHTIPCRPKRVEQGLNRIQRPLRKTIVCIGTHTSIFARTPQGGYEWTPLMTAAWNGRIEHVRFLTQIVSCDPFPTQPLKAHASTKQHTNRTCASLNTCLDGEIS